MVKVETRGRPSGAARTALRKVLSDQVAVPSALRGRGPLDLAEDPLPRRLVVGRPTSAAVAGRQGRQALGVEAGDQVRDGVAGASAGGAGGRPGSRRRGRRPGAWRPGRPGRRGRPATG